MKHYFKNNFMNLKLNILNYPLCEIGFVSTLSEDDYIIIRDKDSFILTGCLGILSMK